MRAERVGLVQDDNFVTVAHVADVAPGTGKAVVVGDREIALFNVDGTFYALDNTCPHQGGPLAEGWIEGETVTCPWHAWCFTMRDGKMTLGDYASVDAFDVRVEGDVVMVSRTPRGEAR
jgi:NAD(P)H-dependent nitrite reductase small subunit